MITGAIKNKIDKIWTDIWAGGISNPLTVIEQLTYLMFIRSLDEVSLCDGVDLRIAIHAIFIQLCLSGFFRPLKQ